MVRYICFEILETGVLAFEWRLSSRTSVALHSRRCRSFFVFAAFNLLCSQFTRTARLLAQRNDFSTNKLVTSLITRYARCSILPSPKLEVASELSARGLKSSTATANVIAWFRTVSCRRRSSSTVGSIPCFNQRDPSAGLLTHSHERDMGRSCRSLSAGRGRASGMPWAQDDGPLVGHADAEARHLRVHNLIALPFPRRLQAVDQGAGFLR
jgi:hypothetical protein